MMTEKGDGSKTLQVEFDRPFHFNSDNFANLYKDMHFNAKYELQLFYGIFNHDGDEATARLR